MKKRGLALLMAMSLLPTVPMTIVKAEDPEMITLTASYEFTENSPYGKDTGTPGVTYDFSGANENDPNDMIGQYAENDLIVNYNNYESGNNARRQITSSDGVTKWAGEVKSGGHGNRMFFRLGNAFYDKVSNSEKAIANVERATLTVTIEFFDGAPDDGGLAIKNGEAVVLFNTPNSENTGITPDGGPWNRMPVDNDRTWKTRTFTLTNATPLGKLNGSDFQFANWVDGTFSPFYVHKVTVTREVEYIPPPKDDLQVHNIYSNNMIFQAGKPVTITGTVAEGKEVTVSLRKPEYTSKTYTGTGIAGADKKFSVTIPETEEIQPGYDNYVINVEAENADTIELRNIVFGDVFFMAGGENIAYSFNLAGAFDGSSYAIDPPVKEYFQQVLTDVTADPTNQSYNYVRFYNINEDGGATAGAVQDEYPSARSWLPINKNNDGQLTIRYVSAASTIFAIEMQKKLNYPIGFIPSAVKGEVSATSWIKGGGAYNGAVYPFRNLGFKGVLWYHGESGPRNSTYADLQKQVISDFREMFKDPELPFCMTGLANHSGTSDFRNVRERQVEVFKYYEDLANQAGKQNTVGLVSLVDQRLDDANKTAPSGKRELADRYVRWANTVIYDQPGLYSGPLVKEATKNENGDVVVTFDNVGDGLKAKGGSSAIGTEIGGFGAVSVEANTQSTEPLGRDKLVTYTFSQDSPIGNTGMDNFEFDFAGDKRYDPDNQIAQHSQDGIVVNYNGSHEQRTANRREITDITRLTKIGVAPYNLASTGDSRMVLKVSNEFYNKEANKANYLAGNYGEMDRVNAILELEYYDDDNLNVTQFAVLYNKVNPGDGTNATFTAEGWCLEEDRLRTTSSGNKKWKTQRIRLNDAAFMGAWQVGSEQAPSYGADIIIVMFGSNPSVVLHKISLIKAEEVGNLPQPAVSTSTPVMAKISGPNSVTISAADLPQGMLIGLDYAYLKNNDAANLMNSLDEQDAFAAPGFAFASVPIDFWSSTLKTGADGTGEDATFANAKSVVVTFSDPGKNVGKLLLCAYSQSGKLVGLEPAAITEADYNDFVAEVVIPFEFHEDTASMKLLLWDGFEKMATITPAHEER